MVDLDDADGPAGVGWVGADGFQFLGAGDGVAGVKGGVDPGGGAVSGVAGQEDADKVAGAKLLSGLEELNAELGVPTPAGYGISAEAWRGKMELMAAQAWASGSPGNNPRVPEHEEIVRLYEEVFG